MGANLLTVVATLAFQSPQQDTSAATSTAHGIAFERLSDLLQYNRVQGLSLGAGYRMRLPGTLTANAYGTLRYGLKFLLTGRLERLTSVRRVAKSAVNDFLGGEPVSSLRTRR